MSEKVSITLFNPVQAHQSITQTWMDYIKPFLVAGHKLTLEVKRQTRTNEQNRLLHSVLSDIASQVAWHGVKFDVEVWKRLCMASWLRERNESPSLIPALDGNGVDIVYEKTSKLSIKDCSEFIEWCISFGGQNGVNFRNLENNKYSNL